MRQTLPYNRIGLPPAAVAAEPLVRRKRQLTKHAVDGVPLQVVADGGGGGGVLARHGGDEAQRRDHRLHLLLPHQQLAGPRRGGHDGGRAEGRRVDVLREWSTACAEIAEEENLVYLDIISGIESY